MKRILTIGVILLFIGVSIPSSTGVNLEPPQIKIIRPLEGYVYFFNEILGRFPTTVIIGYIDIIIHATDSQSGIKKIELFINDELTAISNNSTLSWGWESIIYFRHIIVFHRIKAVAYDNTGNNTTVRMNVIKIL